MKRQLYAAYACQQALEAAIRYLGEQYRGRLEIIDGLPGDEKSYIYNADEMEDCWSLIVPEMDDCWILDGQPRIVCISKKTRREVFFDSRRPDGGSAFLTGKPLRR